MGFRCNDATMIRAVAGCIAALLIMTASQALPAMERGNGDACTSGFAGETGEWPRIAGFSEIATGERTRCS